MNHSGSLIGKIALWLVAALGILFVIMIYTGSDTGIDGGLWVAYAAFGACALMAVGFAVAHLASAGKKALPTLLGLAAFVVVLGVSYAISDGSVRPTWNITSDTSKWIGAGITMTLIATAVAVGAILYGEISRMFK
jgi:hypothetical protein